MFSTDRFNGMFRNVTRFFSMPTWLAFALVTIAWAILGMHYFGIGG